MNKIKQIISHIANWLKSPHGKKRLYIVCGVLLVLWVIFRFTMIGIEQRREIYNPARDIAENGVPVIALEMKKTDGVIKQALSVKNNTAFVSGANVVTLRPGQPVGDGVIVSVGGDIDLDTGMHVVRTRGVADGMHMAVFSANGYFVPTYAVVDNHVFVARDGVARAVAVTVARSDAENAYITDGLNEGDIVILSRVADGEKIQIKK